MIVTFQELDKSAFSKKVIFKNVHFRYKFRTYLTLTKTLYLQEKFHYTNKAAGLFFSTSINELVLQAQYLKSNWTV